VNKNALQLVSAHDVMGDVTSLLSVAQWGRMTKNLAKIQNYELLKMKLLCLFIETRQIWLSYATLVDILGLTRNERGWGKL
jgi:hypothetical protein